MDDFRYAERGRVNLGAVLLVFPSFLSSRSFACPLAGDEATPSSSSPRFFTGDGAPSSLCGYVVWSVMAP